VRGDGNANAPTLTDRVVILNEHLPADVGRHLQGEDEQTARRSGWWPARSAAEDVRAAYDRWSEQWRSGGQARGFGTRDATWSRLIGGCELRIQPDGSGQVAYWTHAAELRKGYASRALRLLSRYAAAIGIARLEAHVAPDNLASRRVAERAGFTAGEIFDPGGGELMVGYVRTDHMTRLVRPGSP
jgi:RimJ/RimL family protein N-acetyltransferase